MICIDTRWFSIAGLVFDIIGALIIGWGAIVSRKKAVKLAGTWLMNRDNPEDTPPIQDKIKQSRNTIIGFGFLITGFILQIIGNWPK